MAGQAQVPVTFEDVAVYLSRAEWEAISEEQQELYRSVMLDVCELLRSLGHPGPKPDILYWLEHGEEPWVCTSQSPMTWDRPKSPSPGRDGVLSCLEEPPSAWWPGTGRYHMPEEMAQIPYKGGQRVPWRLHLSQLLRKFSCLESEEMLPEEVAGTGVEPVESPDQASEVVLLWNGEAAEDPQGDRSDITQSRTLPLHLEEEQQIGEADPEEDLPGSSMEGCQDTQCTVAEVTFSQGDRELSLEKLESVFEDHCYAVGSKMKLWPWTVQEHSYCRSELGDACGAWDHGYSHVARVRYPGSVYKVDPYPSRARAKFHKLTQQCCWLRRIVRKATQVPWLCRPCTCPRCPLRKTAAAPRCFRLVTPAAGARDGPLQAARAVRRPPQLPAAPPQPQHRRPVLTGEALPAPVVASVSCSRAVDVLAQHRAWQAQPGPRPGLEGGGFAAGTSRSAREAYRMVLRKVDRMLGSECSDCLQPKGVRVIGFDGLLGGSKVPVPLGAQAGQALEQEEVF
ncbi:uncharacterized protein [Melanerpes formicivorus]|uniref:uncharacterized protein isoform X2 n=1 Tax=Melanerpes formicivorus TaxID=211600 RepID=UPI00358FA6D9